MTEHSELGANCPLCAQQTVFVDDGYESLDARAPGDDNDRSAATGPPLEALLDNIRSLRNVGSMFRTADGAGVRHMHLGGVTPTPDHPGLAKTALGAERSVAWTHRRDGLAAATELESRGLRLVALEGGPRSVSLFETALDDGAGPIAVVLGHEVSGIDPRIVELCDRVVSIPMAGIKGSLNVSVAFGIAAYAIRYGRPR